MAGRNTSPAVNFHTYLKRHGLWPRLILKENITTDVKVQFCIQIRVSTKTACSPCSPRNKDSFHEKNFANSLRFSLVKLHVKTSWFEVLFVWKKYYMFIFWFPTNALPKTAYGLCSPIYKLSFETFPIILRRDFIWSNSP